MSATRLIINWTFKFILKPLTERAIANCAQVVHCPTPGRAIYFAVTHCHSSAYFMLPFSILKEEQWLSPCEMFVLRVQWNNASNLLCIVQHTVEDQWMFSRLLLYFMLAALLALGNKNNLCTWHGSSSQGAGRQFVEDELLRRLWLHVVKEIST